VNGTEGTAVINPDAQALKSYERSLDEVQNEKKRWYASVQSSERSPWTGLKSLSWPTSAVAKMLSSRWNAGLMESGCSEQSLSFFQPSIFLQTKNSPSFFLTAFIRHEESISMFGFSTLVPTRTRSTSICHRNPIPSWDGVACVCCVNIPNCWKRSCGLCWKCLNNSHWGSDTHGNDRESMWFELSRFSKALLLKWAFASCHVSVR
jgi:hypothetical protein